MERLPLPQVRAEGTSRWPQRHLRQPLWGGAWNSATHSHDICAAAAASKTRRDRTEHAGLDRRDSRAVLNGFGTAGRGQILCKGSTRPLEGAFVRNSGSVSGRGGGDGSEEIQSQVAKEHRDSACMSSSGARTWLPAPDRYLPISPLLAAAILQRCNKKEPQIAEP